MFDTVLEVCVRTGHFRRAMQVQTVLHLAQLSMLTASASAEASVRGYTSLIALGFSTGSSLLCPMRWGTGQVGMLTCTRLQQWRFDADTCLGFALLLSMQESKDGPFAGREGNGGFREAGRQGPDQGYTGGRDARQELVQSRLKRQPRNEGLERLKFWLGIPNRYYSEDDSESEGETERESGSKGVA